MSPTSPCNGARALSGWRASSGALGSTRSRGARRNGPYAARLPELKPRQLSPRQFLIAPTAMPSISILPEGEGTWQDPRHRHCSGAPLPLDTWRHAHSSRRPAGSIQRIDFRDRTTLATRRRHAALRGRSGKSTAPISPIYWPWCCWRDYARDRRDVWAFDLYVCRCRRQGGAGEYGDSSASLSALCDSVGNALLQQTQVAPRTPLHGHDVWRLLPHDRGHVSHCRYLLVVGLRIMSFR